MVVTKNPLPEFDELPLLLLLLLLLLLETPKLVLGTGAVLLVEVALVFGALVLVNPNPLLSLLALFHPFDTVKLEQGIRFAPPPNTALELIDVAALELSLAHCQLFTSSRLTLRFFWSQKVSFHSSYPTYLLQWRSALLLLGWVQLPHLQNCLLLAWIWAFRAMFLSSSMQLMARRGLLRIRGDFSRSTIHQPTRSYPLIFPVQLEMKTQLLSPSTLSQFPMTTFFDPLTEFELPLTMFPFRFISALNSSRQPLVNQTLLQMASLSYRLVLKYQRRSSSLSMERVTLAMVRGETGSSILTWCEG